MYDFNGMIRDAARLCTCDLWEDCEREHGPVGGPFGVPLNMQIHQRPQILFSVDCAEQIVFFGGYPWHYLFSPRKGTFALNSVADDFSHKFDFANTTTVQDKCIFHSDDTGRLVYVSPHKVQFFQLKEENGQRVVKTQLELVVSDQGSPQKPQVYFSSSGRRCIRRSTSMEVEVSAIQVQLEFVNLLTVNTSANHHIG